jgi:hypothetical protein
MPSSFSAPPSRGIGAEDSSQKRSSLAASEHLIIDIFTDGRIKFEIEDKASIALCRELLKDPG